MIVEAILCDWCQKRIPPSSPTALQHALADLNYGSHEPNYRVHYCNSDCQDKWEIAHRARWEDYKE